MVPISPSVTAPTGRKRPPGPDPPEHIDKHPRTELLTPSNEARHKQNQDAREGDRFRRLRGVNRSVMSMLEGALNKDPNADLSTLLKTHAQVYPSRRKKAEERALKGNVCSTLPPLACVPPTYDLSPHHATFSTGNNTTTRNHICFLHSL